MCGRYALSIPLTDLLVLLNIDLHALMEPRLNIAPTQNVPAIRNAPEGSKRELTALKWGLVPSWSKDPKGGAKLINARSESVAQKPSFSTALKYRRCLLPASGFYEWKREGKAKQPFHIHMRDEALFAMAGLWERWASPEGEVLETCTILTTSPNALMQPIHDRMPVILARNAYELWLDPKVSDAKKLTPLFEPFPAEQMVAQPTSLTVNNARKQGPQTMSLFDN